MSDWKASDWGGARHAVRWAWFGIYGPGGTYLSRDSEGNGFNQGSANLVSSSNLTFIDMDATLGQETHTSLRLNSLEFRKEVQSIVIVFIITNVTVTR